MQAGKTNTMKQKKVKLIDKTGNQINVIYPYRTVGGWSFDDAEVGLKGEPFVAGIPEIIDFVVGDDNKFVCFLSHSPIPNYNCHLQKTKVKGYEDNSTGWYKMEGTNMVGWLCPATLKYFADYPEHIYCRIEKIKQAQ